MWRDKLDFFFRVFFLKFSLLHYLSYLLNVFNNGIWKKITNDLEPGLNLLGKADYILEILSGSLGVWRFCLGLFSSRIHLHLLIDNAFASSQRRFYACLCSFITIKNSEWSVKVTSFPGLSPTHCGSITPVGDSVGLITFWSTSEPSSCVLRYLLAVIICYNIAVFPHQARHTSFTQFSHVLQ